MHTTNQVMNRKLKLNELNRLSIESYKQAEKIPVIVVLDNIRSLSNVGSIFRTADCFGIEAIYLCGITAKPPHREITKTAIGATQSVDWKYYGTTSEAISMLKKEQYTIAAIEQTKNTQKLSSLRLTKDVKLALVFGNEVEGVEQQVIDASDFCLEIVQFGTKHSLNVSVCAGIILSEISNQLRAF